MNPILELFSHIKDKAVLPSHLEWHEKENPSQISMTLTIKGYSYSQLIIMTHNLNPVNHDNIFVVNFFKPASGGNCAYTIPFADPKLIPTLLDHIELAIYKHERRNLKK